MIKKCECGCGLEYEVNKRWRYRGNAQRFISGHNLNLLDRSSYDKSYNKTEAYKLKKSILGKKLFAEGHGTKGFFWQNGLPSPRKNMPLLEETKEKLRQANIGKKHTLKTKQKCRAAGLKASHPKGRHPSMETRQKTSNANAGKLPKNIANKGKYGNIVSGKYNINGKIMFFRSGWEANYAAYLDFLVTINYILKWEYEKDVFIFNEIVIGTRSYTPDFKIFNTDGTIEYHEIKGYLDKKSQVKLKRMAKNYPEIKIKLIRAEEYHSIIKKYKGMISVPKKVLKVEGA